MNRRDWLKVVGSALAVRGMAGCDRIVILDDGRDRFADGLSPITPNDVFYTYSCCGPPSIDPATHATRIAHESTELARFTRDDLDALEAFEREHTLECIGTTPRIQNISNAVWGGRPLLDVFDALGVVVPPSAVGLRLTGADGYNAGIPIEDLEGGPIWLVWRMNGVRLPTDHGAPARLLVPGRYGVKNLKWLDEIAFVDAPHTSFWTERGWSEAATYLPNALVATPLDGMAFEVGEKVRLLGTAFAGRDPIEAVGVSVDGGPFKPANLDYATGLPDLWVLWSFDWIAVGGEHTLQARCTTASGAQSVANPDGTNRFNGYDGSMQIRIQVKG